MKHVEFMKNLSNVCLAEFADGIDVVVSLAAHEQNPLNMAAFLNRFCGKFLANAAYLIAVKISIPTEFDELAAERVKQFADAKARAVMQGIAYRVKQSTYELAADKIQAAALQAGY